MKIQQVEIEGFWGDLKLCYDLDQKVNIVIGKNGTGKTHFIKIVEAILSGNINEINNLDFKSAVIKYGSAKKPQIITVEKGKIIGTRILRSSGKKHRKVEYITDDVVYNLNGEEYIISKSSRLTLAFESDLGNRLHESELKQRLSDLFKLVILSVDRLSETSERVGKENALFAGIIENEKREKAFEAILKSLGNKWVAINSEINQISRETEKKVLEALIFDTQEEKIDFSKIQEHITPQRKKTLEKFFSDLDFYDDRIRSRIDSLFNDFSSLPTLISNIFSEKEVNSDGLNTLASLISTLNRIERIMTIYKWSEDEKQKKSKDWDDFISALSGFMEGKHFGFNKDGIFTASNGDKSFKMSELSSGEKQVFYMLTKNYLESGQDHIFLADEPEISLHIEWQEKIVDSLVKLNKGGQYLIATHSPEIASSFPDNVRSMETLFQ